MVVVRRLGLVQHERVVGVRAVRRSQERRIVVVVVVVHGNVGCCDRLSRVHVLVEDRDAPRIERIVALALRRARPPCDC